MKRAVVLQHVPFEGPARLGPLLEARGFEVERRELFRGEEVPARLERDALLIVMGGPMGVGDVDNPGFPFLQREIELLRRRIDEDAPVLGVCLGAQLLAAAAGAQVCPMVDARGERLYEVGWGSVRFTRGADDEAIFAGLPDEAPVLHWHGDTFELPRGASRLASSEVCAEQAFRLQGHLFGLQYHAEVARPEVEAFLRADRDFVIRALGADGPERVERDTELYEQTQRELGDRFLSNLLDQMEK